jgi:hypothetical protein
MYHGNWIDKNKTGSKAWAFGYTQKPRENMLYNMGTENGLRSFDIRRLLKNIENVPYWYIYDPAYDEASRHYMSSEFKGVRKRG